MKSYTIPIVKPVRVEANLPLKNNSTCKLYAVLRPLEEKLDTQLHPQLFTRGQLIQQNLNLSDYTFYIKLNKENYFVHQETFLNYNKSMTK